MTAESAPWASLIGLPPAQLIAMARQRETDLGFPPAGTDERAAVNMLRHDYSDYDWHVVNAQSERLYVEVLDEIARDFPWLAEQCTHDKATHVSKLPIYVASKRRAFAEGNDRQRRGREVIQRLGLRPGSHVHLRWRGERHAQVVVVRRSRVTAKFQLPDGNWQMVDRSADELSECTCA